MTLLLPSLQKARQAALRAVCLSNLSQIGKAYSMYHNSNNETFPDHERYLDALGNVEGRKLNVYLGEPEMARCPADTGEPRRTEASVYEAEGCSYQAAAQGNHYGINFAGDKDKPKRTTDFEYPHKKIITGDYWHVNRDWMDPKLQWHGGAKSRSCNMLFNDGHAVFFRFPLAFESRALQQRGNPESEFY